MRKLYARLLLVCLLLIGGVLSGCSKSEEITLNLSYGDRSGTYSGEMVDGVPNGYGKFTTTNSEGTSWTYEGNFKNGHFDGEGKTTWKSDQIEIGTYKDDVIVAMAGDEIKTLYTSPENFKHHSVEIIGKVFNSPEYTNEGVSFQMWGDPKNSNNNTIVHIYDPEFKVAAGDYIKVIGLVGDTFTGKNALGGEITAPTITARDYVVLSYQEAVAPTVTEIVANQTRDHLGYIVTVQKIELAKEETRVYVKVENTGKAKFSLYSFNSKIVQDGRQFEEQSNWEANYPKVQTDLFVGNISEGIIAFPPIGQSALVISLSGSSDNYKETIEDFIFAFASQPVELLTDVRPEVKKMTTDCAELVYRAGLFDETAYDSVERAQRIMNERDNLRETATKLNNYDCTADESAYINEFRMCIDAILE